MGKKSFIMDIDEKHTEEIAQKGNDKYLSYYKLEGTIRNSNNEFFIRKSQYINYLICNNGVWIYLSDYAILKIIMSLPINLARDIITALKKYYVHETSPFSFSVSNIFYQGKGLIIPSPLPQYNLVLDADFEINYEEFIFLLNMIVYKDFISSNSAKTGMSSLDITLIKYISILSHYVLKNSDATQYLIDVHYLINKNDPFEEKQKATIDKKHKFTKIGFDKILKL